MVGKTATLARHLAELETREVEYLVYRALKDNPDLTVFDLELVRRTIEYGKAVTISIRRKQ